MKNFDIKQFIKENNFVEVYNNLNGELDIKEIMNSKEISDFSLETKEKLLEVLLDKSNDRNEVKILTFEDEFSLKEFLKNSENKVIK